MKRSWPVAAFLVIALSGCVETVDLQADETETPDTTVQVFAPGLTDEFDAEAYLAEHGGNATYFLTGVQGAEPSMGVTSSGAIFMNAGVDLLSGGKVLRSTDRGESWEAVHTDLTGNSDPMMWVDPITD